MKSVLEAESLGRGGTEIIGGDFNAPVGDGIYRMLHGYRDSHRAAGRRWGNTALNTLPLFRPDQIWVKSMTPAGSFAFQTQYSDHRTVVVDVWIEGRVAGR